MPLIISHANSWQKEQRMSVLMTEVYLEGTSGTAGEERLPPLTVAAETLHMYTHIYTSVQNHHSLWTLKKWGKTQHKGSHPNTIKKDACTQKQMAKH